MTIQTHQRLCTAFAGCQKIGAGPLVQVARAAKEVWDRNERAAVLIFEDDTGEQVDLDFSGSADDVVGRLTDETVPTPMAARGPGRPRLGVVGREVTLLPRHWDWLNRQPGGASVALRKLVDQARHTHEGQDRVRHAREAAYRFMAAVAGDLPGFEEASRALFAGSRARFDDQVGPWPADVRDYLGRLAAGAFES